VATAALLVDHTIARSAITLPASSDTVPASCVLLPTTALTLVGRTTTLPTGVFCTVMVAMPDFPPALAATCVVPSDLPVTTPVSETVAMFASRTDHSTDVPDTAAPVAS